MSEQINKENNSYRDKVSTIGEDGKRVWVYPKKISGKLFNYRTYLSYLLLALLFSGPFIRINGAPLFLFNVLERKFVLFGQIFWPQDFHLFVFGMIIFVVFIILFTVIFGRIFCGWFCPQTIFMEMLFRKIEYLIEGDWTKQKKLDKNKWTSEYIWKKGLKHSVFFLISFHISNTFLAYIIGSEELFNITMEDPSEHVVGLVAITIFTFLFYGVFSKMREQVCTTICPYGRMQGVLLDRDSINVTYDYVRGENRAKINKKEDRSLTDKGSCIDCNQCVNVCPTGIDIRNGTQLECINCTACIDACDFMMEKTNQPTGLIRYASEASVADNVSFKLSKRAKAYSAVLVLLIFAFIAVLFSRTTVETTILRTSGMLYQKVDETHVSNLYNYKIINKTKEVFPVTFEVEQFEDVELKLIGKAPVMGENEMKEGKFMLVLNRADLDGLKTKIKVNVYSNGKIIEVVKTSFVGPSK